MFENWSRGLWTELLFLFRQRAWLRTNETQLRFTTGNVANKLAKTRWRGIVKWCDIVRLHFLCYSRVVIYHLDDFLLIPQ